MKRSLLFSAIILLIASGSYAQTCTQPVISEVKGAGTYCEGEEVTLEVVGTLNNATAWTWYSTSCGGQSLGTGTTLKVTVNESVTYFVRGTGACVGTTATCAEVEVKLDDIAPEILTCTEDIVVANEPGLCSAVVTFDAPTAEDNCSDEVTIEQIEGPESGSVFPVGVTLIAFEISDELGNKDTCSFTVTVKDEELPVIACPADITVDNDPGECGAVVTYEVPVGTDNCPEAATVRTTGLGSGAFFPVGTTTDTYTVTDASGNTATCSFTVTVKDVEPPVITMKDKDIEIWPPNHKHHSFFIADQIASVSDNCGGVTIGDVIIDEVGSDEPNNGIGDGNTTDDIVIDEECRSTQLRAERSGTGNGRVYVVSLALMDLHGNIGTAQFTVKVPHDKGKKSQVVQDDIVYTVNGCDLEFVEPVSAEAGTETPNSSAGERLSSSATAVYPNPYNRTFTINFTPSSNDYIKVELYNLMGMKVTELHEQSVEGEKTYEWTFEPPEVTNGTGVLIIRGGSTFKTIRLMQQRSY